MKNWVAEAIASDVNDFSWEEGVMAAAPTNLSSLDFFHMEILSFEIVNDILAGFEIESGFSSQLANWVLKNDLKNDKLNPVSGKGSGS